MDLPGGSALKKKNQVIKTPTKRSHRHEYCIFQFELLSIKIRRFFFIYWWIMVKRFKKTSTAKLKYHIK